MSDTKKLLNELLVNIFNYIVSIENLSLRQTGVQLSMNEIHILEAIEKTDPPNMTNVASRLLITPGSLTTSIDTLEKKGYVERVSDERDRRKVLLTLTEESKKILKEHDDFHKKMIEHVIRDMNIEENGELIHALTNLADYFRDNYLSIVEQKKND